MSTENLSVRDDLVIRRLILEPGEATPWHTDPCQRFSVVVRGEALRLEYRDSGETLAVPVQPGMAGWDEPEQRVHRAVNAGSGRYEEITTFVLDTPGMDPQPRTT